MEERAYEDKSVTGHKSHNETLLHIAMTMRSTPTPLLAILEGSDVELNNLLDHQS